MAKMTMGDGGVVQMEVSVLEVEKVKELFEAAAAVLPFLPEQSGNQSRLAAALSAFSKEE